MKLELSKWSIEEIAEHGNTDIVNTDPTRDSRYPTRGLSEGKLIDV